MKNVNEIMVILSVEEQKKLNGGGFVGFIGSLIGGFLHRSYSDYMDDVVRRMNDGTAWRMTD